MLATLMEGKMSMQSVAPEDFQRQMFQELKELEKAGDKRSIGAIGTLAQVGKIGR